MMITTHRQRHTAVDTAASTACHVTELGRSAAAAAADDVTDDVTADDGPATVG